MSGGESVDRLRHGDHDYAPGVDQDFPELRDPRWCNVCGEALTGPLLPAPPPVTAGREQDARETLRAEVERLCDAADTGPLLTWPRSVLVRDLRAVLALLPSPPATTGAGDWRTDDAMRADAASDWLRDALEGLAHAAGIDRDADYGPKPNGVLLDDLHLWVSAVRCRHCGTIGTPGEDHTCTCPKHDNDCTEHLPWPSTTGLPHPLPAASPPATDGDAAVRCDGSRYCPALSHIEGCFWNEHSQWSTPSPVGATETGTPGPAAGGGDDE